MISIEEKIKESRSLFYFISAARTCLKVIMLVMVIRSSASSKCLNNFP